MRNAVLQDLGILEFRNFRIGMSDFKMMDEE